MKFLESGLTPIPKHTLKSGYKLIYKPIVVLVWRIGLTDKKNLTPHFIEPDRCSLLRSGFLFV